MNETEQRYVVDHDHACCPGRKSCGKCVRGILCIPCNAGLGFIEKLGVKAIENYLGSIMGSLWELIFCPQHGLVSLFVNPTNWQAILPAASQVIDYVRVRLSQNILK